MASRIRPPWRECVREAKDVLAEAEHPIMHRLPLDEASSAFRTAANDHGTVKVVVYP